MSQEKVDRYKESKATRRERQRKARRKQIMMQIGLLVVAVLLVVWIGYSVVRSVADNKPKTAVEVKYDDVNQYLTELNTEPAEDEEAPVEEVPADEAATE